MDGLKARLSFDAVAYDYDDEYLTIDTDTHIININNVSRLFGVQYDGNSKLIKFRINNKLSDIQKMQDSIVYINWIDQKGVKGQSIAIDKTISNDICEFAWKVPFDALKNSGVLHFAMSAVITENGSSVINQKWSTQIASVITPDGIYIKSYTPSSEEEDRIAQIYNELTKMINKQNDNLQSQINSITESLGDYELSDNDIIKGKFNNVWFQKNGSAGTANEFDTTYSFKIDKKQDYLIFISNGNRKLIGYGNTPEVKSNSIYNISELSSYTEIITSSSEYEYLYVFSYKGDTGANTSTFLKKINFTKMYNTINEMKNDYSLKSGMYCATLGYYKPYDNGNGNYIITTNLTANEMDIIELNNGLFAKLMVNDVINIAKLGGKNNITNVLNRAIEIANEFITIGGIFSGTNVTGYKIYIPKGNYTVNDNIVINAKNTVTDTSETKYNGIEIYGDGKLETILDFKYAIGSFYLEGGGFYIHDLKICNTNESAIRSFDGFAPYIKIENVILYNCVRGVHLKGAYLCEFNSVYCHKTRGNAFQLDGTYTSTIFRNCYADICEIGFLLDNMQYSSMISCACDKANVAYSIRNGNLTMVNCGAETIKDYYIETRGGGEVVKIKCDGFSFINNSEANEIMFKGERGFIDLSNLLITGRTSEKSFVHNNVSSFNTLICDDYYLQTLTHPLSNADTVMLKGTQSCIKQYTNNNDWNFICYIYNTFSDNINCDVNVSIIDLVTNEEINCTFIASKNSINNLQRNNESIQFKIENNKLYYKLDNNTNNLFVTLNVENKHLIKNE